jgi:hypothetical protein
MLKLSCASAISTITERASVIRREEKRGEEKREEKRREEKRSMCSINKTRCRYLKTKTAPRNSFVTHSPIYPFIHMSSFFLSKSFTNYKRKVKAENA